MDLFKLFFIILVLLLITILGLWIVVPPEAVTGTVHPEFSTMMKSGESVSILSSSKWLSFFYGFFIMVILCISVCIGFLKRHKLGGSRYWLLWGSVGYLIIYIAMVMSYWSYVSEGFSPYFLGFPAPTAWMLYGVWIFPVVFTLLYVSRFEEFILSGEDIRRFTDLVMGGHENTKK